jgi:hypothetical protein
MSHGLHPWLLKGNPVGVCYEKLLFLFYHFFVWGCGQKTFIEHLLGLSRTCCGSYLLQPFFHLLLCNRLRLAQCSTPLGLCITTVFPVHGLHPWLLKVNPVGVRHNHDKFFSIIRFNLPIGLRVLPLSHIY